MKMKLKQKAKKVLLGAIAITMAVPLVVKATDAVPITFSQGDVLSAEVLNTLFSRLNDATGEVKSDDLIGTWTVKQIVPFDGQPGNGSCRTSNSCNITGTTDSLDGMSRYRTDTVTFSKNGNVYSFTQSNVASFVVGHTNTAESGTYSVIAETAIFKTNAGGFQYYYAKKKSANQIVLQDIKSGSNSFNMLILTKQSQPPAPPTTLTATTSGTSVALTWKSQSTDETGFKVQTKTTVAGAWTTLTTTAASVESFNAQGTAGNNWYRVLATNANGDSVTSNEIFVEIK
jgi:hypothetical protein